MKKNPEKYPLTWMLKDNYKTVWINEYIKNGGYSSFFEVIKNIDSCKVISIIKKSGLKGRGGAGFSTGDKWNLMKNFKNKKDIGYFICNADEMEPGSYKDRFILENFPHMLLEGLMIASYATGASISYIFLRGEYFKPILCLKRAIAEAKKKRILGKNILGTQFSLKIFLHTGAGRYICGEETALLNSLEGYRANPRIKPPFPGNFGLWGKPTCINNVETLCNVPCIIKYGYKWYRNLSINSSKDFGTKLMGFSGRVKNPGIWELPFGTTARELLEKYAQGMCKGFSLKAWLPGGSSTSFLTYSHIDTLMDFESLQKIGSRLGTGIAIAIDNTINMVSLMRNIEEFFSRESCGLCTPCREGLPWIVNILKKIESKLGDINDINLLKELCFCLTPGKTFCAYAPGAISPLISALKFFKSEFKNYM